MSLALPIIKYHSWKLCNKICIDKIINCTKHRSFQSEIPNPRVGSHFMLDSIKHGPLCRVKRTWTDSNRWGEPTGSALASAASPASECGKRPFAEWGFHNLHVIRHCSQRISLCPTLTQKGEGEFKEDFRDDSWLWGKGIVASMSSVGNRNSGCVYLPWGTAKGEAGGQREILPLRPLASLSCLCLWVTEPRSTNWLWRIIFWVPACPHILKYF